MMPSTLYKRITPIFLIVVLFSGCVRMGNFEKNIEIPKHDWQHGFKPTISFEIHDTIKKYNVFLTLRHTDAYAYRNLWLLFHSRQPSEKNFRAERIEIRLQDEQGRWLGRGMDDIREFRFPLFTDIRFTQTGEYTIQLEQIMRDNPLKGVMNAGIRIEQSE